MVEEARKLQGHIGNFRFEKDAVQTAYQLSKHDRLELSANHPQVGLGKEVGSRKMAEVMFLLEEPAAPIVMKKIEF